MIKHVLIVVDAASLTETQSRASNACFIAFTFSNTRFLADAFYKKCTGLTRIRFFGPERHPLINVLVPFPTILGVIWAG